MDDRQQRKYQTGAELQKAQGSLAIFLEENHSASLAYTEGRPVECQPNYGALKENQHVTSVCVEDY